MRNKSRKYVITLSYVLLFTFFFFTAASFTDSVKNFTNGLLVRHGYLLTDIRISGSNNLRLDSVHKMMENYKDRSIIAIPISGIRKELLKQKWVSGATVIMKLPNIIMISIDEHKPFAIFGNTKIVADDLRALIPIDAEEEKKFTGLLKVYSQNFKRTSILLKTLKTKLDKGTLDKLASIEEIADRRWNLTFKNGTVIKLPEKNLDLALNRVNKILQKNPDLLGLKNIDLRLLDKTFFS
ncbi:cell division FtsQ family protein [Neorickettsia helminthoeca str. Oregon]|uniref:Cell division FtsQ family protein n=1 Tax=Neorickettsia helminthoeca str. Oregon TaxID=1286528 RepID=X5HKE5_9RICK|nr:cell division protein FtsQ/DivIB [Neorickettsia helminthoeca]AHX11504.1 cell division FtsQ family protein [Neorickettsia helminthoeca str. Oregon]